MDGTVAATGLYGLGALAEGQHRGGGGMFMTERTFMVDHYDLEQVLAPVLDRITKEDQR